MSYSHEEMPFFSAIGSVHVFLFRKNADLDRRVQKIGFRSVTLYFGT